MKNRYLDKYDKIVMVSVKGSNINSYLSRVIKKRINIIKLVPISYKEVHLVLKYSDYEELIKYKSIYNVRVIKRMGRLGLVDKFKKNFVLFIFIMLGIIGIFVLSNVVMDVEVIHQDREVRELVLRELHKYNINKYTFKKKYDELERIEDNILNNNKDRLEWIEIVSYGTKYIVRIEERKVNKDNNSYGNQNIVSKKDAVIVRIDAISGEKVKNINDYVRAGEVIISGNITLPDNTVIVGSARGKVYGEVWYQVNLDYPFVYQESSYTGKKKIVYNISFFGKNIGLFNFNKFRTFDSKNKVFFCSNFLDICFVRQKQYEVLVLDDVYTEDIVRSRAIEYIKNKMFKDNNDIKEIRDIKILNSISDDDSIRFKLFVKVVEDIGRVSVIENSIS